MIIIIKQIAYLKSQYEARQRANFERMQIIRLKSKAKRQAELMEQKTLLEIQNQEILKNECRCGLLYSQICNCEITNYDVVNTNDYWCKICGNIKNDNYYGCKCFTLKNTKSYYYFCITCKRWKDKCL